MDLYRIARERYIEDLSGEGSRIYGGRWNFKGTPVLYTSQSESLAALETLVHAPVSAIPDDLNLLILSVPDNLKPEIIQREELPGDWRNYPAPNKLAEIGAKWINSTMSVMLKVPSVLVQTESNILINPLHSDMEKIEVKEIRPFCFDTRLLKRN
ncbi:MAG: RES family NAD+ phosphorylase [Balneolaceae bacterium]|nr:RES family NAD+ phosphorylase [Balneolaceae bacterium]